MNVPFSQLHYRAEDRILLDVPKLSRHARVSSAFIHLCLVRGCPSTEGRLSQAMLLDWLFQNYETVRAGAGLPPMASIEGVGAEVLFKLKMGNALLTLLEFSEMRSSNLGEKRRLRNVHTLVARSLDRL